MPQNTDLIGMGYDFGIGIYFFLTPKVILIYFNAWEICLNP